MQIHAARKHVSAKIMGIKGFFMNMSGIKWFIKMPLNGENGYLAQATSS